ncbi:NAD(P)-dependent oxidoreductase [Gordonia sp. TBRC 11910]|uniref:NAD(P)-dependent oxidoreductase n=1 Tax=Gordonia asplenii TaxID=2725283 RepID=A0A848L0V3_9ACTN|nr:NAD(P)-dependent oxidoreductase [Gordonia asplenii]NMO02131.1 NAD(P)-dependent oxidoreductase [Gordonia asplenii]
MTPTAPLRLGYVGLGNIGGPMAEKLARGDSPLTVYDLDETAVAKLVDAGASAATSLAQLGTDADIISICVVDDAQVRTVVNGLLTAAPSGTIIAIHSTINPATAVELAQAASASGVVVVDAPISGGAQGAAQGRLAVMVGGPREAYERIKPAFAPVSDLLVHAGDVGAGTRMKLARNLLHFISFAASAEASRLAEAAGIDLSKLGRVVRHTDAITGGAGAIMLRDTTAPIAPDDFWYGIFSHVRDLGEKDLSLASELASQVGVELRLGDIALANLGAWLGVPRTDQEADN